ncbi:MAG: hypothetical protein ABF293_10555 [Flavobacteriaceae bacterium]
MKTLTGIAIVFALILTSSFISSAKSINKTSNAEVYAVHELEIKSDTDMKAFEKFVLDKIAPIYNKMEGQELILVKGDRGVRTGKYSILLTFDSLEDRNRIYPPSGEYEEDFGDQAMWDKFDSMVTAGFGKVHTDYVQVVQ